MKKDNAGTFGEVPNRTNANACIDTCCFDKSFVGAAYRRWY